MARKPTLLICSFNSLSYCEATSINTPNLEGSPEEVGDKEF